MITSGFVGSDFNLYASYNEEWLIKNSVGHDTSSSIIPEGKNNDVSNICRVCLGILQEVDNEKNVEKVA